MGYGQSGIPLKRLLMRSKLRRLRICLKCKSQPKEAIVHIINLVPSLSKAYFFLLHPVLRLAEELVEFIYCQGGSLLTYFFASLQDFDGDFIGKTVAEALTLPNSLSAVTWTVVSPSQFPHGPSDVAAALLDEQTWAAVTSEYCCQQLIIRCRIYKVFSQCGVHITTNDLLGLP